MTAKSAEAAFFWRYSKATFSPVYGRLGGGYTKDFLQSPAAQWPTIDEILGEPEPNPIKIEFRWPGGKRDGHWQKSAVSGDERGQLKWVTAQGAPIPWRLGDPSTDVAATIPGDPSKTTAADADAEFAILESKGLDPWLVAIKLRHEAGVLHVRAYLGNPPAGFERRGIQALPRKLREAIRALPQNTAGGAVKFDGVDVRAPELVAKVLDTLKTEPNILLIGPPGTGKTVVLEEIRQLFELGEFAVTFDPELWDNSWHTLMLPDQAEKKCVSLVFHPSYSYEEFVAGLVPQPTSNGFRLVARAGPLLSLAHWANEPNRYAALIIDEFNRGPAAAIFGDTLALLDAQKRNDPTKPMSGAAIQRPYPTEVMELEIAYAQRNGERVPSTSLRLPQNLWIVAALNSTDRSVAPLDAALRRRFAIIQVPPDYNALAAHFGIPVPHRQQVFTPPSDDPENWTATDVFNLAFFLLRAVNQRIFLVLGSDFLLGHALLWSVKGSSKDAVAIALGRAFDERVAATLRLTFVDQDEPLAAILKLATPAQTQSAAEDRVGRWLTPPPELQDVASPRLELTEVGRLEPNVILRSLRALL